MANFDWITQGENESPDDLTPPKATPPPPQEPPVEGTPIKSFDFISQGLPQPEEEPSFMDNLLDSLTPGLEKTVSQINQQNRPVPVKPRPPEILPPYDFLEKELTKTREGLGPDTTIEPSDPFGDLEAEDKVIKEVIPAYQVGALSGEINEKKYKLAQHEWRKANPMKALVGDVFSYVFPAARIMQEGKLTENEAKKLAHEVDQMNIRLQRKGKLMTTDDLNGFGDWVDYLQTMTASSAEHMGKAILSGGTMTPILMIREMNANLDGIEGLDINERMALAHTGGLVAAALENLGLGILVRGMPKEVLGKIGVKKMANFLEKTLAARVAGRAAMSSLTEGMTEGSQEGVAIVAEKLAGKDFKPGEISSRLFEATAAGATVGVGIGGFGGIKKGKVEEDVKEDDKTFTDEKGQKWMRVEEDLKLP